MKHARGMGTAPRTSGRQAGPRPVVTTVMKTLVQSHRSNRREAERGQIMVILAILLPLFLGSMALGTDLAVFYFEWAALQKAADAAALAGAGYLPGNPQRASATATKYAKLNGMASSEITSVAVGEDDTTMTVSLSRSVPFCFGKILGFTQSPVSVSATAAVEGASAANGVLPVGIDSQTEYSFGQQITLFDASSSWGPGNWGALALGQGGASTFAQNVTDGYSGTINAGDLITTQTGVMAGPTQTAFDTRITAGEDEFPNDTYNNHSLNDPRAVTVPIVDFAGINGNSQVPVDGFARIWLVGMDQKMAITAIFLQEVVAGGEPGGSANYGGYNVVLIR